MPVSTPLLDTIQSPEDLRHLPQGDLVQVASELRAETIDAAATTGGHFGAGLGVVELTVALHYVFNTPEDRVIWDVSHQTYPHKILTGRRDTSGKSGSATGSTVLPSGAKAISTALARPTVPLRFRRALAWLWRAIYAARITMSFA